MVVVAVVVMDMVVAVVALGCGGGRGGGGRGGVRARVWARVCGCGMAGEDTVQTVNNAKQRVGQTCPAFEVYKHCAQDAWRRNF